MGGCLGGEKQFVFFFKKKRKDTLKLLYHIIGWRRGVRGEEDSLPRVGWLVRER